MKRLLRNSKLVILTMVLALVGLTVAATASPAAHAATTLTTPTITTSVLYYGSPEEATLNIQGANFTLGGSVKVEVLDSSWNLVYSRTITASFNCYRAGLRLVCTGGAFSTGFVFYFPPSPPKTYYVIAYDYGTGRWSNWSSQPI
jgi:hypothetical protein